MTVRNFLQYTHLGKIAVPCLQTPSAELLQISLVSFLSIVEAIRSVKRDISVIFIYQIPLFSPQKPVQRDLPATC